MKAFNSLSRDHVVEVEGRLKLILISLSTPSLGITLPIDCSMFITDPNFQLPLSGSLKALFAIVMSKLWTSFNSLSRDHAIFKASGRRAL